MNLSSKYVVCVEMEDGVAAQILARMRIEATADWRLAPSRFILMPPVWTGLLRTSPAP